MQYAGVDWKCGKCETRESMEHHEFLKVSLSHACYEIQYTWTARSTETETETGLDRYVMLGARWLTEY